MTAISANWGHVWSISSTDLPVFNGSGVTAKPQGKILCMLNVDTKFGDDTLNLESYLSGQIDIDGISYITLNGIDQRGLVDTVGATARWSTSTITFQGHPSDDTTANWRLGVIASLER